MFLLVFTAWLIFSLSNFQFEASKSIFRIRSDIKIITNREVIMLPSIYNSFSIKHFTYNFTFSSIAFSIFSTRKSFSDKEICIISINGKFSFLRELTGYFMTNHFSIIICTHQLLEFLYFSSSELSRSIKPASRSCTSGNN